MTDIVPTIYIVDDDLSVRESLAALVAYAGFCPQLFGSAQEFLLQPVKATPGCLLLDVNLPDLNGLELLPRMSADRAHVPVIFITGYADIPMTVQAMKAGAVEFLTKPLITDQLLEAIAHAVARSRMALSEQAELRSLIDRHESLSSREREVLALVVGGQLNKQIGAELGISEITVKAHRGRVMRKMHARSLAELVRLAARLGLAGGKPEP